MKSTLENENNSSNKITDNKIITNEIAIMLEESNFLENLILLMVRIILLIISNNKDNNKNKNNNRSIDYRYYRYIISQCDDDYILFPPF